MKTKGVVRGQPVSRTKLNAARRLRKSLTPQEDWLWGELRRNRLSGLHFRRQQVVLGWIVDFYCHQAGLVVEIDGPHHDRENDADRDKALEAMGLKVLRIPNRRVDKDPGAVLEEIKSACGIEH